MPQILAVDYGTKRLGVAVSDPEGRFALPLLTLELPVRARAAAVAELASERSVKTIVIGRPVRAGGEDSALWTQIESFGRSLVQRGFAVAYEDEAFTSSQAAEDLGPAGSAPHRRKAQRPQIDALAARLILEQYLERARARMTKGRLWLWCRTVAGAAVVYATVPILVVAWIVGKLVGFPGGVRRRLILAAVALPFLYGAWWMFKSHGTNEASVMLQVRSGMSFASLTDSVAHYGVIRHPLLFRVAARLGGFDRKLHVGLYEFVPESSPYDVLRRLARHEQIHVQFTVVEGATMREFLPQIAHQLQLPVDSLEAAVRAAERRARLGVTTDRLEGYLFPETYSVPWGADAATAVDAMTLQFETVWSRVGRGYAGPLNRHQAVTLASLIEAEAKDGSERTRISSVFHNRLKRKMRLQCDPTVIYAMGGLDRPLLRKDWRYESPYNTYLVAGLPPGPICSPGEAALHAALFPDTTDLLYFVAQGDGTHVFSRTLAEHERAIAQIKQNDSAHR